MMANRMDQIALDYFNKNPQERDEVIKAYYA